MKGSRIAAVLAATAVIGALIAPAARAGSDDTTATVTGAGSLGTVTMAVGAFGGVTLDGTAKTSNATADDFDMTDARGTGDGWNITVDATRFCDVDDLTGECPLLDPVQLPTSSLTMPAPTVAKADSSSSAVPSITAGPYTLDSGSAVKIASAAAGDGMGSYDFTQGGQLSLSIPASAYAATYTSTVTITSASGP